MPLPISNLCSVSHRFLDTATWLKTFHWKLQPNRCRYGYSWQPIGNRQRSIREYHRRSLTINRLVTIPTCVHPLQSSKDNDFHVIRKPICDFPLVINSNLCPISHRLATIHPWQTDDNRQQPCHRRLQRSCSASKSGLISHQQFCMLHDVFCEFLPYAIMPIRVHFKIITSAKEVMFLPDFVCLSVCVSAR